MNAKKSVKVGIVFTNPHNMILSSKHVPLLGAFNFGITSATSWLLIVSSVYSIGAARNTAKAIDLCEILVLTLVDLSCCF